MKLSDCFKHSGCVFSMEVFPPKKDGAKACDLFERLAQMARLAPHYISVTYGAGGTAADSGTCEIASHLKNVLGVEPLAHLTCVGTSEEQTRRALQSLAACKVENVLALRGDCKPGQDASVGAFAHASDLTRFIKRQGDFCVAGACYPEGHVESHTLAADVANLRYKLEAGAEFLVTQLFFDNGCYYRLLNMARKAGCGVPIEAGVMPIVTARQIQRTVALSGASLPPAFTRMVCRYEADEKSLYEAGIEYAVQQLRDLIEGGADGVHLYVMNNAEVARRVYEGIEDLLPSADERRRCAATSGDTNAQKKKDAAHSAGSAGETGAVGEDAVCAHGARNAAATGTASENAGCAQNAGPETKKTKQTGETPCC